MTRAQRRAWANVWSKPFRESQPRADAFGERERKARARGGERRRRERGRERVVFARPRRRRRSRERGTALSRNAREEDARRRAEESRRAFARRASVRRKEGGKTEDRSFVPRALSLLRTGDARFFFAQNLSAFPFRRASLWLRPPETPCVSGGGCRSVSRAPFLRARRRRGFPFRLDPLFLFSPRAETRARFFFPFALLSEGREFSPSRNKSGKTGSSRRAAAATLLSPRFARVRFALFAERAPPPPPPRRGGGEGARSRKKTRRARANREGGKGGKGISPTTR